MINYFPWSISGLVIYMLLWRKTRGGSYTDKNFLKYYYSDHFGLKTTKHFLITSRRFSVSDGLGVAAVLAFASSSLYVKEKRVDFRFRAMR